MPIERLSHRPETAGPSGAPQPSGSLVYGPSGHSIGSLGAIAYPEVRLGGVVSGGGKEPCESRTRQPCTGTPEPSSRPHEDPEIANWKALSEVVYGARYYGRASLANPLLEETANRFPHSPFSSLYRIWIADNYCFDGRFRLALESVQSFVNDRVDPMFAGVDLHGYAYELASTAAEALGEQVEAAHFLRRAISARSASGQETASRWLDLGRLYDSVGDSSGARQAYSQAVRAEGDRYTRRYAECEIARLGASTPWVFPTLDDLAVALRTALMDHDAQRLIALASATHFSFGVEGAHFDLAGRDLVLPQVIDDLLKSPEVDVRLGALGSGRKRYLESWGWAGCVFHTRCLLMVREVRGGWEWSGITSIGERSLEFAEQLSPVHERFTNQPLEIAIKAPWPAGIGYQAGGIGPYTAAVGAGPFGWLWIMGIGDRACGFGPGGFYYNNVESHTGEDQFAVDFSRWQRGHAFPANHSRGPVLAVADGYVVDSWDQSATGETASGNYIDHRVVRSDQLLLARPSPDADRLGHITHFATRGIPYTAKYLHLDGPSRLTIVRWQWVEQGWVLGMFDDTGSSAHDHLHLQVYDGRLRSTGHFYGDSVRLDPFDRDSLGDGSDGTCVVSTNEIRTPLLLCLLLAENAGFVEEVAEAMQVCRATLTDPAVPDPAIDPFAFCDYLVSHSDNPTYRALREIICARLPLVHLDARRAAAVEEASRPAAPYRIGER